ncbi:hypothetical protein [Streptomyces sp. NPDC001980]|uniref:hypothetical protein n=1 Tax=Streptomyces sp. NPDC001980 TaxID=3157126 RepID=UPI00331D3DBC
MRSGWPAVDLFVHTHIAEPDAVDAGRLEREHVAMLTRCLTAAPSRAPGSAT